MQKTKGILIISGITIAAVAISYYFISKGNKLKTTVIQSTKNQKYTQTLPEGLTKDAKGVIHAVDGTVVKTFDAATGAYQEEDGTWYLASGAPLMAYDANNGFYQEEGGTWYTFDGTALSSYDATTGHYVEASDPTTTYDSDGKPIN